MHDGPPPRRAGRTHKETIIIETTRLLLGDTETRDWDIWGIGVRDFGFGNSTYWQIYDIRKCVLKLLKKEEEK